MIHFSYVLFCKKAAAATPLPSKISCETPELLVCSLPLQTPIGLRWHKGFSQSRAQFLCLREFWAKCWAAQDRKCYPMGQGGRYEPSQAKSEQGFRLVCYTPLEDGLHLTWHQPSKMGTSTSITLISTSPWISWERWALPRADSFIKGDSLLLDAGTSGHSSTFVWKQHGFKAPRPSPCTPAAHTGCPGHHRACRLLSKLGQWHPVKAKSEFPLPLPLSCWGSVLTSFCSRMSR